MLTLVLNFAKTSTRLGLTYIIDTKILQFDEVYTFWSNLCYKISPKIEITRNAVNIITLNFAENMPESDIPNIQAFFTSAENAYGIIDVSWIDGDVWNLEIDPREQLWYR